MTLESLKLDLPAIAGADEVIAIKSTPHYPWDAESNSRSKTRTGSTILVVCPAREFERFSVTITGQNYDKLFNGAEPLMVTFEGFEARFYKDFRSGEYVLTAKADEMIPVTEAAE